VNSNLTSHNIYSTLMCGLRIFAGHPIYHLLGSVISETVGFVYIISLSMLTCSHNMSNLARVVSFSSRSLEKFDLGALSSLAEFVHGYWHFRFDLPSSINLRDKWFACRSADGWVTKWHRNIVTLVHPTQLVEICGRHRWNCDGKYPNIM